MPPAQAKGSTFGAAFELVHGEEAGTTTSRARPQFELGALGVDWADPPVYRAYSPPIFVLDLRVSPAVIELQRIVSQAPFDSVGSLRERTGFPEAVRQYWEEIGADRETRFRGIKMDAPGQDCVTTDRATGHRVGIHLDNWHRRPAGSRQLSPQRLALNLGPGSRWILLTDTREFWREVCENGEAAATIGTPRLRAWRSGSGAPVYRYRIDPGFAYLASTEFYGHDASSRWSTKPSVSAQWWNVPIGLAI